MNAWLEINRAAGIERRSLEREPDTQASVVAGSCPGCGASPFRIVYLGLYRHDNWTWKTGGKCLACKDSVGWVYVTAQTIFGTEEDSNVLNGRARVYT